MEEYYLWKVKLVNDTDEGEYEEWETYLVTETPDFDDFKKALDKTIEEYQDEAPYKLDAMQFLGLCLLNDNNPMEGKQ